MIIYQENYEKAKLYKKQTRCVDVLVNGEVRFEIMLEFTGYNIGKYSITTVEANRNPKIYSKKQFVGTAPTMLEVKKAIRKYIENNPEQYISKQENHTDIRYLPSGDASDFYSTPSGLAGKMFSKIKDWDKIQSVLEPTAGKGDLIDAFKQMIKTRCRHIGQEKTEDMIDAIEIDPNLACLLKGKGIRVISDDFLSFNSNKIYDLIIANFPFSEGDRHLMHAVELIRKNGGQVVALVNAETIRNPYTNLRKELNRVLTENNAYIEFIKDAFVNAERKTSVETALVSVCFPKVKYKSDIFEHIHKATEEEFNASDKTALVSSDEIISLVEHFNAEARMGIRLMQEYSALDDYLLKNADSYDSNGRILSLSVGRSESGVYSTKNVNAYMKKLRLKYWKIFLDRPFIREKMTSNIMSEYQNTIRDMEDYDFDIYNVRQVFYDIMRSLGDGVKESILKMFDTFSAEHAWFPECENNIHYYNGWATNKAHKVGMKVILPINGYSWNKSLDRHGIYAQLSDFEKALAYLEKGESFSRMNLDKEINYSSNCGSNIVESTYFTATFYKKGTCHIKMKPEAQPLIDRMNIFCAQQRNWLPPTYGRKRYSDMSEEEQAVINEFQGKEEYEKVADSPADYLLDTRTIVPQLSA